MTGCATLGREKRVNLIDKHRWRSNLTTFSFSQLLNYYSLSRRLLSLPFPPPRYRIQPVSRSQNLLRGIASRQPLECIDERAKFPVSLDEVQETSERTNDRANEETIEFGEGSGWIRVKLESRVERNERKRERDRKNGTTTPFVRVTATVSLPFVELAVSSARRGGTRFHPCLTNVELITNGEGVGFLFNPFRIAR